MYMNFLMIVYRITALYVFAPSSRILAFSYAIWFPYDLRESLYDLNLIGVYTC